MILGKFKLCVTMKYNVTTKQDLQKARPEQDHNHGICYTEVVLQDSTIKLKLFAFAKLIKTWIQLKFIHNLPKTLRIH